VPQWWAPENLTPIGHRPLRDADIAELGNYLTHRYDFGATAMAPTRSAIHAVAERLIFDELSDWISGLLEWDEKPRLDGWLATYAGADTQMHSEKYLAMVGSKYVMQVLHRGLHPGAKADYSLVLCAAQGVGKDLVLGTMFAPYYHEGVPSPRVSQADFALSLSGALVAHAAEMSAWRKSDVEEQKSALTRCVDHGRRAYGYEAKSYPRRTCLAFSTNDIDYQQDTTGGRRYWGVSVIRDRVDVEGLRRDRDQLLAEALFRLQAGEQHWPTVEEEDRIIAAERQHNMPDAALEILDILERFLTEEPEEARPCDDVTWRWIRRTQPLSEVYLDTFFRQCFGTYAANKRPGLDRASKRDTSYCTTWLRAHGWRRERKRLLDGQRVMVWVNPTWQSEDATQKSKLGCPLGWPTTKEPSDTANDGGVNRPQDAAAAADASVAPDVATQGPPKDHPRTTQGPPYHFTLNRKITLKINNLALKTFWATQRGCITTSGVKNLKEKGEVKKSLSNSYWRKLAWVARPSGVLWSRWRPCPPRSMPPSRGTGSWPWTSRPRDCRR
jgi:predicted P-loop ATPase